MPSTYRVVMVGGSIFLLALGASLLSLPQVEVRVLPPQPPVTVESLVALAPDLVVLASHAREPALMLALLHAGVSLLEVDGYSGHAYLLQGHAVALHRITDLEGLLVRLAPPFVPFP